MINISKRIGYTEYTCNQCGERYRENDMNFTPINENNDSSWVHEIRIEQPGFGSVYDLCNIEFHLCDKCLDELIKGFKVKIDLNNGYY